MLYKDIHAEPKFLGVQISRGPKKSGAQMRSGTISVIALFLVNKYLWPWPELPLTCHSGLSMTICHKADKPSLNFYSKWVNIGSFLRKKLGPAPQMKILPWAITWHLDCRALGESWYILCMVSWRLWNFQASHQDRIQIRVWVHTLRVWMFFFTKKEICRIRYPRFDHFFWNTYP